MAKRCRGVSLLLSAALMAALALPAAARGAGLTAEERREVADLLRDFGRRGQTPDERDRIADRIIEIGGYAPEKLAGLAERLASALQPQYAKAYYALAARTYQDRLRRLGLGKRDELRRTIRGVIHTGNLTKEKVVEEADPALGELESALLLKPETILAANPPLAEQRDELLSLLAIARRCRAAAGGKPLNPGDADGAGDDADPAIARIEAQEELAALLVLAEGDRNHTKVLTDNVSLEREIRPEEARGIRRLNELRLLLGMNPLLIDVKLCLACRDHSKDMAEKGFFSHDSPVPGKERFWDRARNFGTTASAENIANGKTSGPATIMQWWHSPGHLKNMMRGARRTGLGHYEKHWTQLFGG